MVTHPGAQKLSRRDIVLAPSVVLLLLAVYILTYRGGFHSVDEVSMYAVTESLVKFGQLNTDQIAWTQWTTSQREAQGFFGLDGHVYSKKGLALSLLMAPWYWLGLVLPGIGMLQTASMVNPLVTAITGGVLYLCARRLGTGEKVAAGVALVYGLATIAWVYSKYLFSEPLAGLLLASTFYFLITYSQTGKPAMGSLAGLTAGLAVISRANNAFLVPLFGLYLVWSIWRWREDSPRLFTIHWFIPLVAFGLGLVPAGVLFLGYNWVRAGHPLQTGYDLTIFSPNVLVGLYKLLFSPLRGLFIYSPVLVLSLPGLVWLWRRHRAEAGLIAGTVGVTVLLFSAWTSGEGLSWGSRFLVPVVPLLCLALAPVLERVIEGSRLHAVLFLGLVGISLIVQLLGVIINPWVYLAQLQADFGGEFFLEKTAALGDFRYSQIVGQIQSWSVVNSDLVWWQPWRFDRLALGLCVFLVLACAVHVTRLVSHGQETRPANEEHVPGTNWQNHTWPPAGWTTVLVGVLTLALSYVLLARYYVTDLQFGPQDEPYTQALNAIHDRASPGDRIVSVARNHYHVPMNRFKERLPIIGFAQQRSPLPDTALPLLNDSLAGENTWLVTAGFSPASPDNAAEEWLADNAFKANDAWFADVRLVRYATPAGGLSQQFIEDTTQQEDVSVTLGGEIDLVSVANPQTIEAGRVLPVEITWVALAQPKADYNLFLQLLSPDGIPIAQHDGPPRGGYAPATTWSAGTPVIDHHGLYVPDGVPDGNYHLIAGLYDPATGRRLYTPQGQDFVELGSVAVQSDNR